MILSSQSLNLVSLGGWFYNTLNKSYNVCTCKAAIENYEHYSLTLFFEWTNANSEYFNDVLILSHRDSVSCAYTRDYMLTYLKNSCKKMPLFFKTERNFEDWNKMTIDNFKLEIEMLLKSKINSFLTDLHINTHLDTIQVGFV